MSQITFVHFVKLAQKLTIIYSIKGLVLTSFGKTLKIFGFYFPVNIFIITVAFPQM